MPEFRVDGDPGWQASVTAGFTSLDAETPRPAFAINPPREEAARKANAGGSPPSTPQLRENPTQALVEYKFFFLYLDATSLKPSQIETTGR